MGDQVIKMFKDRIWETLKEKEKTIHTLLKETSLPPHIISHQDHYKRILDTALNCCKE
jgi:protoheme ferro-lyase